MAATPASRFWTGRLTNGLYVAMGLDVDHERRGFDYDNTNAVARQFAQLMAQVREYQRPPGLDPLGHRQ